MLNPEFNGKLKLIKTFFQYLDIDAEIKTITKENAYENLIGSMSIYKDTQKKRLTFVEEVIKFEILYKQFVELETKIEELF